MDFKDLQEEVISRGLCMGCGACAGICPTGGVVMEYVDHELEPLLKGKCTDCSLCYEICPGEDIPLPDLDKMVFGRTREPEKELLGIYRTCFAAYAAEPVVRSMAAGGGVVSALLLFALERGLIEKALVGTMDSDKPWRTRPLVASNRKEIISAMGSKYQFIATNANLEEAVKSDRGVRTGHVGLPCHIHALRKGQLKYPSHRVSKALSFTIGIWCFSNYYCRGNELFLLQRAGISSLEELAKVQYRVGQPMGNFRVTKKNGQVLIFPGREILQSFLWRSFRCDRCLMCIDWSAELADISVGDYWGPPIEKEDMSLGWNTIIVRTEQGEQLLKGAEEAGYIVTYPTEEYYIKLSGGFDGKKQGAVHTLLKRKRWDWPTPDYHYPLTIPILQRSFSYDHSKLPHLKWLEKARERLANDFAQPVKE